MLNVFFWGINQNDGTSDNMLTKAMALRAIADLNIMYNNANIFFKYKGYDYINSSRFYEIYGHACESNPDPDDVDGDSGSCALYNFLDDNPQYENDEAINFYIPKRTFGFRGTAKFDSFRAIIDSYTFENASSGTTEHEMGHLLKLEHPHTGWHNETSCEHVTRDPNDVCDPNFPEIPCFNAKSSGDCVVDTAAAPDFRREHYWELRDAGLTHEQAEANDFLNNYIDPITCEYQNINGNDCLVPPIPYEISVSDVLNFLSYSSCEIEDRVLTTGQGIRVRETIAEDINNAFFDAETTITDLYEPYAGSYPPYYPHPQPWEYPTFQPGFEYRFVECGGDGDFPQPTGFFETFPYDINNVVLSISKDETDYSSITHPNHTAIYIIHHDLIPIPFPRKCYDNYDSPPIIGGAIMKFNDGVFNANVTISPKDSTAINQPNLIQDLENGLYKIEKNYEGGSSDETIVIKENN